LSATALKVTVEPQTNVTIGGGRCSCPCSRAQRALRLHHLEQLRRDVADVELRVGRVEERLQLSFQGASAVLRGRQGDAGDRLTSHWLAFAIVYSLGLNQQSMTSPPSIWRLACSKPVRGGSGITQAA
jgi:hypothetical protein